MPDSDTASNAICTPCWQADQASDLAYALGDVVLAWSQVEHEQNTCLAALLHIEYYPASRLIQSYSSYFSRHKALSVLIELHPNYSPIIKHLKALKTLADHRNDFIHGLFLKEMDSEKFYLIDRAKGLEKERRSLPITPLQVRQHAAEVRSKALALYHALHAIDDYRQQQASYAKKLGLVPDDA